MMTGSGVCGGSIVDLSPGNNRKTARHQDATTAAE
jgi:hypothetical protein